MNSTNKPMSNYSHENVLRGAYSPETATIGVGGFLAGKVGHKIEQQITTTNVANDTVVLTFKDGATSLLQYTIIYSDGARTTMLSAERTA